MKKFLSIILSFSLLCSGIYCLDAHASSSEVVSTVQVTHQHTANSGSCYTPVYHTHSGNSGTRGGCYQGAQSVAGTHRCGQAFKSTTGPFQDGSYNHFCNYNHITNTSNSWIVGTCGATITDYKYALSCGKTTSTIESYNLTCGKNTSTVIGTVSMTKSRGTDYVLGITSDLSITGYSWQDGSTGSSIVVNGNKEYTCTVTYTDNGVSRTKSISYTVSDFDNVPPTINNMVRSTVRVASAVVITVNATDNVGVTGYKLEKK